MLRAFFGHHKAATTWARNILRDASVALRLNMQVVHTAPDWAGYDSLGDWARARQPDILVLTNARREDVETLPELRGVHVIRDPRDILVSGYFSHRNSHPEVVDGVAWEALPPHRRHLHEVGHDEGLLAELDFITPYIESMSTWSYHRPDVLELRMEDLIADPHRAWRPIFTQFQLDSPDPVATDVLRWAVARWNLAGRHRTPVLGYLRRHLPGLPLHRLPASYLDEVVERYSFASLTGGRPVGQEDEGHHYRRGVAGDWRNHLKPVHLQAFRDRFGDLVERLGYEW
ncbi:MAG: sulfotransferase domain-containing protein [Micromonosporaceae bacterium]